MGQRLCCNIVLAYPTTASLTREPSRQMQIYLRRLIIRKRPCRNAETCA